MEPARRQWLAAFTLALLLHAAAGMTLIASWQERPRLPATAGAGGMEVALFPAFEQALREASIETPDLTGTEAAPLEPALVPPELAPLEPTLPQLAEAVPAASPPERTESTPVPLDTTTVPTDIVPLESVEPSRVAEAPAAVTVEPTPLESVDSPAALEAPEAMEALPVERVYDAVEPVDLDAPPATSLPTVLADLPAEPLDTGEAPAADPIAPTEIIPVPQAAESVAVADTVDAFEIPERARDAAREEPVPIEPPLSSVSGSVPPSAPGPVPELPVLAPLQVAEAPFAAVPLPTATAESAPVPVEPEAPAALPDVVETFATPAPDPTEPDVLQTRAMAPMEIVRAREPEPAPRPAEQTLREPAESDAEPVSDSPSGTRSTAPAEALEEGIVAAAPPPPSASAEDAQRPEQPARPGIEAAYLAALQARLERYKDYPRPAQRRGEEGTVLLRFTINRYGMVIEHAIVQSSGFQSLDNSVEHMIRRAQPLPAIPHEMGRDWMQVILPVQFQLER